MFHGSPRFEHYALSFQAGVSLSRGDLESILELVQLQESNQNFIFSITNFQKWTVFKRQDRVRTQPLDEANIIPP